MQHWNNVLLHLADGQVEVFENLLEVSELRSELVVSGSAQATLEAIGETLDEL